MTRFIMPIVLVVIAVTLFLTFTNPLYNDIVALKTQVSSYNDALNNSKALENERDKLTAKYNTIDPNNLSKLEKLLPANVDNVRLILEIGQIAAPYGMTLSNVSYNKVDTTDTTTITNAPTVVQGGVVSKPASKDYGKFDLGFSTTGTYSNFINFTKDLESNLRIADILSISFSSNSSINAGAKLAASSEIYTYNFKIQTYWLKN